MCPLTLCTHEHTSYMLFNPLLVRSLWRCARRSEQPMDSRRLELGWSRQQSLPYVGGVLHKRPATRWRHCEDEVKEIHVGQTEQWSVHLRELVWPTVLVAVIVEYCIMDKFCGWGWFGQIIQHVDVMLIRWFTICREDFHCTQTEICDSQTL